MKVNIVNFQNQIVGEIDLQENIFGLEPRPDILARVVHWQLAKRRSGTHKTKTISEISGTTKKPYKQKGTGNARQGSTRSAQFRGGSTAHGPVVRSHEYSLPKKIRKLGLKSALSLKFSEGKIFVVENLNLESHKTSALNTHIKNMNLNNSLVISQNQIDINFQKAISNIKEINLLPEKGANVYDILRYDKLVFTPQSISDIMERLK